MSQFSFAAGLLALAASATVHAEGFRPVAGVGFTFGGDKLATLQFTDGSRETVKSGGLMHLYGGVEYQAPQSPIALQASFGYHVDDSTAKNAQIKFQRWPLEFIGFYQLNDEWRIGLGARKATGAKFSSSGVANGLGDPKLSSKTGTLVQADYLVGANLSLSLRFVSEKYSIFGAEVSGNHTGLYAGYRF